MPENVPQEGSASVADFPIVIKVWAGKERHDFAYLSHSIPSLLGSRLPDGARVILIDDQSIDPRVGPFLDRLAREDRRVEVWRNPHRMGPNKGQEYNIPRVVDRFPNAEFLVLCDDDIVYHSGWLQRLIQVYREGCGAGRQGIYSAINYSVRPAIDSIDLPTSTVLVKPKQAALNWLLPKAVYDRVGPFRDVGIAFDTDYLARLAEHGMFVYCMKPSYVQNIGYQGAYQRSNSHRADDYVGRLPLRWQMQDRWYSLSRTARSAAEWVFACVPEGRLKQFARRLRSRVSSPPPNRHNWTQTT